MKIHQMLFALAVLMCVIVTNYAVHAAGTQDEAVTKSIATLHTKFVGLERPWVYAVFADKKSTQWDGIWWITTRDSSGRRCEIQWYENDNTIDFTCYAGSDRNPRDVMRISTHPTRGIQDAYKLPRGRDWMRAEKIEDPAKLLRPIIARALAAYEKKGR